MEIKLNRKKTKKYSAKLELSKVNWEKAEKIFSAERLLLLKQLNSKSKRSMEIGEILKLLAGGAVFGMSLAVPSLPKALAPYIIDGHEYGRTLFSQNIKRLKKQKLVNIIEEAEGTRVMITQEGKIRALRYKLSEIRVKKPKVWDRKWRVVIFDIPEKYKRMREIFRKHLQIMGFYMLQKSVWVHPYQCFNEIEFLRQIYDVGIDVTYLVAEKVENPRDLQEHFQLN